MAGKHLFFKIIGEIIYNGYMCGHVTRKYHSVFLILSLICLLTGMTAQAASGSNVPKISVEELKANLGNPDLIIIDVRIERDWKASALKIPGAVWEDFLEADAWVKKYPKEKTIVLYCD
ncbi:MAG: Rhodanese-related sulfurtransferase [Nitrospirae bacterium]|nr:Rhodanese-related sulfurtransferase [Nitrospirota bacterium]